MNRTHTEKYYHLGCDTM